MADAGMQMAASAEHPSRANSERQRAYADTPAARAGGLDTGARGWRFAVTSPASRQMQGSEASR